MKVHAIAGLWPAMQDDEWSEFVADVAENGLLQPIVTWRGEVVDGKHRARACEETGVVPRYDALPAEWDEWRVVLHCSSLHRRRNLTPAQRAAVGAEAKARFAPAAKARQAEAVADSNRRRAGKPVTARGRVMGTAAKQAAEAVGSTERAVERAERVRRAAPEVHELVKAGKLSGKVAERIAKEPDPVKRAAKTAQLDTGVRDADAGDSWGTPQEWLDIARQVMGGIDLDPASNVEAQAQVRAGTYYTKDDDGLSKQWSGRVWLNPPYSQPLVTRFAEKLVASLDDGVTEAIVLVNNATDTKFCQLLLERCAAALFPSGRVSFLVPGSGEALNGTRQGQVLIYFGGNTKRFVSATRGRGWVGVAP